LLQLKHKTPSESVELATDIIENQFDAFTKKHYEKLIQKYNVSNEQLKKAIHEIEKLNQNQVVLLRETIKLRKM
jgi:RNA polymerase sigma-54 factor